MKFKSTNLHGAWLVEPERVHDGRGHFARTFCVHEFRAQGLETEFVQHSMSYSSRKGTVRGMHFQRDPHAEVKLVRCLTGSVWDVIVDLRPDSPTFRRWSGFELSEENGSQLYVPKGFGHGFQALSDDVRVNYLISNVYVPTAATGVRHDDPAFSIEWPLSVTTISEKDMQWPTFAF